MNIRLTNLLKRLERDSIDGLLVSSEANVSYLAKYKIEYSYLLLSPKENFFITDFRYAQEASDNIKDFNVVKYKNLFNTIASLAKKLKIKRLGFESKSLNYAEYTKIKEYLGPKIRLVDTFNLVEKLREAKDNGELTHIRKAISISASAFEFLETYLEPGRTELEIAGEIERFIRLHGAEASAFSAIVASGPNSSYPHAGVSRRKVQREEPIIIDMGVEVSGYKSDLTRVFFLGRMSATVRKIHNIIREAQLKAIEEVKPTAAANKIDAAGRRFIERQGYSRYFGHSLGHGVGLEVHEDPSISAKNKSSLKAGMVFTIEPGIYIPGKFGIRLEDMVLVTEKGVEVLSGAIHKSI